jgi:ubiquinone/menaquinone biosynthesis C-methylase UbiE
MGKVTDAEQRQLAAITSQADFDGRRVLEIGCGDGRLTRELARRARSIDASDPDADAIAAARAALPADLAGAVTFTVAAAADLDVPRCSIDLVFFSWSL